MRNRVCVVLLALVAAALFLAGPASAQGGISPAGTYTTEWASYDVYISPSADAGTRTVEVVALESSDPYGPAWEFRDASTGQGFCWAWSDGYAQCGDRTSGSVTWIDETMADGTFTTVWFVLDFEIGGHSWGRAWEVGTRQPAAPPGPTVSFNLTEGQTVSGTVPVRMTATGLGAGGYRWYISVDGAQVAYRIESTTAITWWWNTGSLATGSHVLSVRVVDGSGLEARGAVNVRK